MAHAQKPDFVFRRKGRVHLNRRGGTSVQSTTGSRGVRISGSNAGYTMFRGSVKWYWLLTPLSSFPFTSPPCVNVYHHISTGVYQSAHHRTSEDVYLLKHYSESRKSPGVNSFNLQLPIGVESTTKLYWIEWDVKLIIDVNRRAIYVGVIEEQMIAEINPFSMKLIIEYTYQLQNRASFLTHIK